MEKDFPEYIDNIAASLQDEGIGKLAARVGRLGKFRISHQGDWEPVHYAGYTLITPTAYDDLINADSLRRLQRLQKALYERLNFGKIIPAPAHAFHMTVARLISGEEFARNIMGMQEDDFRESLHKSLAKVPRPGHLVFEIKGITILPEGVIAALLAPINERDYQILQNFRDLLYSDQELINWGVERRRAFKGHITLCYIEEDLNPQERTALSDCLIDLNREYLGQPLPFIIYRAEIRRFNNFQHFYRSEGWPYYYF